MALPTKKTRQITVDNRLYRWLVTEVNQHFEASLFVEDFDKPGQKAAYLANDQFSNLHSREITPAFVKAFIQYALSKGWQPQEKGTEQYFNDFKFLPSYRSSLLVQVSALPIQAVDPLELSFCTDLDPIRTKYTWAHYYNMFARFTLSQHLTDVQLGTLVAHWAATNSIKSGTKQPLIFEKLGCLSLTDASGQEVETSYDVRGGMQLWEEGSLVMNHGCCMSLDQWVEWRDLCMQQGEAWNGHDPASGATWENGQVCFKETEHKTGELYIDADVYQTLMQEVSLDLQHFLMRLEQWLAKRTTPTLAARITLNVANHNGIRL